MPTSVLDMKLVSHIIGSTIDDAQGHVIGNINNMIIDVETGRVAYAIVSRSGFMGMSKKLFAVPWPAIHTGQQANSYVIDADREVLRHAPELDSDHLPDWTNMDWNRQMYAHYHISQFWHDEQAGHATGATSPTASHSDGLLP